MATRKTKPTKKMMIIPTVTRRRRQDGPATPSDQVIAALLVASGLGIAYWLGTRAQRP